MSLVSFFFSPLAGVWGMEGVGRGRGKGRFGTYFFARIHDKTMARMHEVGEYGDMRTSEYGLRTG